ncbi:transcriptional regulator [Halobiforma lacisalsi AJ5]|uniref:Transcriptional regulator n=1 Tax=Natronobacterium lacisalsi AJ5 TaxID=358396 RepID=M0LLV6_NATLA|nr:helix-turn-helix domain-containing protein [Halobiforma lacisalsi]APW97242.1 transcriptional regulator [Halobiforma lacisalsi AJ5]EMA34078.1 hypothetical protein C445_08672 [Halobiforma lacisalsi AJ5]
MTERDDLAPEDAFALVGDETRARIIRVLNEERDGKGAPPVLSFSELYDRFDEVGSSQFNYHLQKLVGHFVERTEDGYRVRPEGMALYRTLRGGTFRRLESTAPIDVGLNCYCCGAAVTATYEDGVLTVQCPDCDHLYLTSTRIPSRSVDDEEALLSRLDQFDRHKLLAFNRGVCPTCAHAIESRFVPAAEAPFPHTEERDLYLHRSCERCGNVDYVSVGKSLLEHPAVVSFLREHGTDPRERFQWEFEFAMTDRFTTVRSRDPWTVAIELTRDGETLELIVDEEGSVRERTRSTG